jgi:molecular chaperone GrpE
LTDDREHDGAREDPDPSQPTDPTSEPEIDELDELEPLEPVDNGEASDSLAAPSPPSEATGDLRKKVEEKDAQLAQVMSAYRSLKKETEKLRKRAEQHQKRRFEQSKNDFIGRFVEVLDNLDRAIDSVESNFDSDAVLEGIILVRSRLVQLLLFEKKASRKSSLVVSPSTPRIVKRPPSSPSMTTLRTTWCSRSYNAVTC